MDIETLKAKNKELNRRESKAISLVYLLLKHYMWWRSNALIENGTLQKKYPELEDVFKAFEENPPEDYFKHFKDRVSSVERDNDFLRKENQRLSAENHHLRKLHKIMVKSWEEE